MEQTHQKRFKIVLEDSKAELSTTFQAKTPAQLIKFLKNFLKTANKFY